MTQRRFTPTLWPTLFTIPALLVPVGLGTWQLQRMQWKTEIIDTFEARMSDKAIDPPVKVDDIEKWRFKRVILMGKFLHQQEFTITGKTFEGTAGFHLITPLQSADGRITLINRGWIPERLRLRNSRPETLTKGRVLVDGIIREDKKKGYFVPENEPQNNVWLYINSEQMATKSQIGSIANYYIDMLRKPGPYTLPIGASSSIKMRNEHLQYALTWYFLALSLLIIYVIYHYRTDEK